MSEQLVGWVKRAFTPVFNGLWAVAQLRSAGEAIVRRAHALHVIPHRARTRGHGAPTAVPSSEAVPPPLPTLRAPSSQPKSDASDLGYSRGGEPGQTRARMGWGEGIPPSRDRD